MGVAVKWVVKRKNEQTDKQNETPEATIKYPIRTVRRGGGGYCSTSIVYGRVGIGGVDNGAVTIL